MKGRLNLVLWRAVALNVVILLAIVVLAYGAGTRSGGLSILDFGALPGAAGLWLWASALIVVFAMLLPVWMTTRILHPLKQLTEFSESLGAAGAEPLPPMATDDDFTLIADHLRTAAEQLAVAATDQSDLALLRLRIAEFADIAQRAAAGDWTVRAAAGDDLLGQALANLNTTLETMTRVLEGARTMAGRVGDIASTTAQAAHQAGKTLMQQERDIATATEAFAVIPPSVKQVTDNSSAVMQGSQNASAAGEQARQALSDTLSDLRNLTASLRSSGDTLSNLRHATEHVAALLRPLKEITERANLLALNAVLDAARAGQAGRTSSRFAEQFRDLAQESTKVNNDVSSMVESIHADCDAVLSAVERDSHAALAAEAVVTRTTQLLATLASAMQETRVRAEVVSLASARQADAARSVTGALQSAMDLQRLAAQQTRQNATTAEQLSKAIEELKSALAAVRTTERGGVAPQARAAVGNG